MGKMYHYFDTIGGIEFYAPFVDIHDEIMPAAKLLKVQLTYLEPGLHAVRAEMVDYTGTAQLFDMEVADEIIPLELYRDGVGMLTLAKPGDRKGTSLWACRKASTWRVTR